LFPKAITNQFFKISLRFIRDQRLVDWIIFLGLIVIFGLRLAGWATVSIYGSLFLILMIASGARGMSGLFSKFLIKSIGYKEYPIRLALAALFFLLLSIPTIWLLKEPLFVLVGLLWLFIPTEEAFAFLRKPNTIAKRTTRRTNKTPFSNGIYLEALQLWRKQKSLYIVLALSIIITAFYDPKLASLLPYLLFFIFTIQLQSTSIELWQIRCRHKATSSIYSAELNRFAILNSLLVIVLSFGLLANPDKTILALVLIPQFLLLSGIRFGVYGWWNNPSAKSLVTGGLMAVLLMSIVMPYAFLIGMAAYLAIVFRGGKQIKHLTKSYPN
jgi:hypothetical protein